MKLLEPGESGKLLDGTTTASGSTFLPFDNESLIVCSTGIHANRSKCFWPEYKRTSGSDVHAYANAAAYMPHDCQTHTDHQVPSELT